MENQRVFIWVAVALAAWMNYEVYQRDYGPRPAPVEAAASTPAAGQPPAARPVPQLPAAAGAAPAGQATPPGTEPAASPPPAAVPARLVHVRTDVLDLEFSTRGGEVVRADLLAYPQKKDRPELKVRLFDGSVPEQRFVFQSGLSGPRGTPAPDASATYDVPATEYELAPGKDSIEVPFTWSQDGVSVTKTLTVHRGHYAIDIRYDVRNSGSAPWTGALYGELIRHYEAVSRSMWNPETYAYRGPAMYTGAKYEKLDVTKPAADQLPDKPVAAGWAAAMQHHFVAAFVPPVTETFQYGFGFSNGEYAFSAVGAPVTVAPGASAALHSTLYAGPKLKDELEAVSPTLTYTNDYGVVLTPLAKPLFWLLSNIHRLVGNWGVAIILVTVLLKLILYYPAQYSGRSMARMRNMQPRMKDLQERYKDNREELGKQMMELYKREKINPVAGCLPMLLQIPVFIAFYWVLLETVDMRQAPFAAWIQDLSSRDPYFVLPAIMGVAMFGQFKLNPAPPDPMQAKIFAFMPLVMTATMAFFPAGLVLYWITNTTLSIVQQWHINKVVAAENHKARN